MPMSFPDFESLKRRAAQREFRQPHEDETEEQFREAFANFMFNVDRIESSEIRTGRGWNNQHPFELLNNSVEGGLGSLIETLNSKHYEEGEGADGFLFNYKFNIDEKLMLEGLTLQEHLDHQHRHPFDKENFGKLLKRTTELKAYIDKLYLGLETVDVLLNNGLNEG